MRELNYLEIRTYVRSGAMDIDINPHVFVHPQLTHLDASALDYTIKQEAFNDCFAKISDSTYNPKYKDELQSNTKIYCRLVIDPRDRYIDTRELSGYEKLVAIVKNWFRKRNAVVIKPKTISSLSLNIRIIENSRIPTYNFMLNVDLIAKGLKVVTTHASVDNNTDTYVVVYNDSSETIEIEDLSSIGSLRILNSDYIHM